MCARVKRGGEVTDINDCFRDVEENGFNFLTIEITFLNQWFVQIQY